MKRSRVVASVQTIITLFCIFQLTSAEFGTECECSNEEGETCTQAFRQFGQTRYWVLKDDSGIPFQDAHQKCRDFGLVMADIISEADQDTYTQLIQMAGSDEYWIGIVKHPDLGYWTMSDMSTPVIWYPDSLDHEADSSFVTISVDSEGEWHPRTESDLASTVCQFPWNSVCNRDGIANLVATTFLSGRNGNTCPEPISIDKHFVRTGPNSKYLAPSIPYKVRASAVGSLCQGLGLEAANIDNMFDYKHVANDYVFANELDKTSSSFALALGGIHPKAKDGPEPFYDSVYSNPLPFQLLRFSNDYYYKNGFDCLALQCQGVCYFQTVSCEARGVVPFCQYKRDDPCFTETPLAIAGSELKDELIEIATSSFAGYFGSTKQDTWEGAKKRCEAKNLELVSLEKNEVAESKFVNSLIEIYKAKLGIPNFQGFWTAGIFENGFDPTSSFTFVTNGEVWDPETASNHFDWVPSQFITSPEDEKCLMIMHDLEYPRMRPVICDMPSYYICYEEYPKPTEPPTTEPPTTVPSANTGPNRCIGETTKISWSPEGLTDDEIMGLVNDSLTFNFKNGYSNAILIKEDSTWRIPHVKAMGAITKKLCDTDPLPKEFINVLMNLIMIYYHNMEEEPKSGAGTLVWDKLEKQYKTCLEDMPANIKPISAGGLIYGYETITGNGTVGIVEEKADLFKALDYILEGLWYMFQVTAATCYEFAPSKTNWLASYFYYFRNDFTEPFKKWWVNPGHTNYGLLFGDLDLTQSLYNLRICGSIAYQWSEIEDRMFVRPVALFDTPDHILPSINEKV